MRSAVLYLRLVQLQEFWEFCIFCFFLYVPCFAKCCLLVSSLCRKWGGFLSIVQWSKPARVKF